MTSVGGKYIFLLDDLEVSNILHLSIFELELESNRGAVSEKHKVKPCFLFASLSVHPDFQQPILSLHIRGDECPHRLPI